MKDPASEEAQEEAGEQQEAIALACAAAVLGLIAKGLKKAKGISPAQVAIDARAFEAEVERTAARYAKKAEKAARDSIERMADGNDEWASRFFKAKGMEQTPHAEDKILSSIVNGAADDAASAVGEVYDTSAMGIVRGDRLVSPREAYVYMANDAAAAARAGDEAFDAALRRSIDAMARSGLRTVGGTDLPKVRYPRQSRELYSAARMNEMGAYRAGMQAMREEQGRQFGADGVEVSAHGLCAPDHLPYQGRQYSKREFDLIQGSLGRPLVTGANCGHSVSPILLGISVPAYSDGDLSRMRELSNETVTFKGVSGRPLTMTRYEASQYQRGMESNARKYATRGDLQEMAGVSRADSDRALERISAAYNRVCSDVGLTKRRDRMRSYFKM